MANKTILMSKIRQIFRMHAQGTGKKQISALTGIARNTIKKYLHKFIASKLFYADIEGMTDHELDQFFAAPAPTLPDERHEQLQQILPIIEKQLKRKGITRLQLWATYRQQYPDGYSRSHFNHHLQQYLSRSQPVMHMEHKAGDKLFVDFAGDKLSIVDTTTGEVQEVEVFVATLGCSQLTYVEAVNTQRKEDFIKACENALHYLGGVPAAIVPDNLKSAVIKSSKYEPTINETFADFAEHYSMAVLPARAYRPKDKALVEGAVKLIYRSIYLSVNQTVHASLTDLNLSIWAALELYNDALFKGRDYSRRMQFEELERSELKSLAQYRYELKQQAMATVMKNGYICLRQDTHYYSVPYRFIGKKVKLIFTSSALEVYHEYERIATHSRSYVKYKYSTQPEHLASSHRYLSEWTPEKFIQQAAAIDEAVAIYINKVIIHKQHPEQAYKSCSGILSLARKAGKERLAGACRRADSYGIYNYPIIVEILAKKLDTWQEDSDTSSPEAMPDHINIRGNDYYE